jgi:hypothetical protein
MIGSRTKYSIQKFAVNKTCSKSTNNPIGIDDFFYAAQMVSHPSAFTNDSETAKLHVVTIESDACYSKASHPNGHGFLVGRFAERSGDGARIVVLPVLFALCFRMGRTGSSARSSEKITGPKASHCVPRIRVIQLLLAVVINPRRRRRCRTIQWGRLKSQMTEHSFSGQQWDAE